MSEPLATMETMNDMASGPHGASVPRTSAFSADEVVLLASLVSSLEAARRGIAAFQALEANLLNTALALALEHVDASRPGGMMPARRCDLDHLHDAAHGGETDEQNLADTCRRHHVLKHHSAWRPRKSPDGAIVWTSPAGRRYPDRVIPRVAFLPDAGPPAFVSAAEPPPF